jgi:hypothetical protein
VEQGLALAMHWYLQKLKPAERRQPEPLPAPEREDELVAMT